MNRRQWIAMCGMGGISAALGGCAATTGKVRLDEAATARLARDAAGWGIWRGGRLVAGSGLDARLPSLSITKACSALCAVRAIGDGWLTADASVAEWFPQWPADRHRSMSVRMLVNMTAGLPAGVPQLYRGRVRDKGATAAALPAIDPPGSVFRYGPACWELLGELLHRGLSRSGGSLEAWLRETMTDMGIGSAAWRRDQLGRPYLSTGAEWSVAELARLGQTIGHLARGGNVGRLRATAFEDLAKPVNPNPMFAAGIWWNRNAGAAGATSVEPERQLDHPRPTVFWRRACLAPTADAGWLALVGSGGKRVFVLPQRDIVIVRLSRGRGWSDGAFLRTISA